MPRSNVDIVKATWDAWSRGDVDGVLETHDPAAEWDTTSFDGWPEADAYRGHEGVRRFLDGWLGTWEWLEAGADEYIQVDRERVLVVCWQRALARGSQVPVRMDYAVLCTLSGGVICRMEFFSDQQEALEGVQPRQ